MAPPRWKTWIDRNLAGLWALSSSLPKHGWDGYRVSPTTIHQGGSQTHCPYGCCDVPRTRRSVKVQNIKEDSLELFLTFQISAKEEQHRMELALLQNVGKAK